MKKNPILSVLLIGATYLQAKEEPLLPQSFKEQKTSAIAFTENKGQVHDQNYKARPDVLFGVMTGNMAVHIRNNGVSYQLYRVDRYKEVEDPKTKELALSLTKGKEIDQQTIYRIDLNWINHNTNFTTSHDETLPGYNNYYLENCPIGALNVKSYTGITLNNIYKGINLHYYEKNNQLKHDYIIAPHSDYKLIQLEVKGADITINKDGSLILSTPLGKVHEGAPIVYQNGKQLKAKWVINRTSTSLSLNFDIENYDPNYELYIDPVTRLWGTYYGSGVFKDDYGNSCATDGSGNVYLAGFTEANNSGTVIATSGSHQSSWGGGSNYDAFLVKFNASGIRQWGTYYGGNGDENGYSCASDGFGNVYLAGGTNSNNGTSIATSGSHQSANGGSYDAFLVKFDVSGVRQWGTYYGGSGSDNGYFCTTDGSGNVYLAGTTASNSSTVIATSGAHQAAYGGSNDAFIAKFNASGTRQWGTYYGGNNIDYGYSCTADGSGNVYLAGFTESSSGTVIATSGSHQSAFGGGSNFDSFLVKFDALGIRQWGTYYGSSSDDYGYSCATDGSGNVYLAGYTASNSGTTIATAGSHQSAYGGGNNDAFLVKFNTSGIRQWGTYYGGSGNGDIGYSCITDGTGNVYLAGGTDSNSGTVIATSGSHQSSHGGGGYDAYLVKFDASGIRQWGTYYGGSGNDIGYDCATDGFGNLYLAGQASSNNSTTIATSGSHQSANAGQYDAFLVKFVDCVVVLNPVATVNSTICSGSTLNFTASISGTASPTYSWSGPNSFTAAVQNPIITGASALNVGVYTLNINNAGCVETATTQVNMVNPLPTVMVNSASICVGNSFTLIPSGANTYTIQGGNAVVSPIANTTYTVIGASTAGCLSANIATSSVTVYSFPTVAVNSGSICSGSTFTLTPSGANSYTIQGGNAVVNPTTNMTYTVIGANIAGCLSVNTASSNISVNSNPPVTALSNETNVLCLGLSASLTANGAITYIWNTSASTSVIVVSPTLTTSYTVTGTHANGCMNKAIITQSVDACTGINTLAASDQLKVYPNPNHGIFTLDLLLDSEIELINALGQIIFSEEKKLGKHQIDISQYQNGIYLLKVISTEGDRVFRVIKQ